MTPEEEANFPYRTRVERKEGDIIRVWLFVDLDEAITFLKDMVLDESAADDDIGVVYSISSHIQTGDNE